MAAKIVNCMKVRSAPMIKVYPRSSCIWEDTAAMRNKGAKATHSRVLEMEITPIIAPPSVCWEDIVLYLNVLHVSARVPTTRKITEEAINVLNPFTFQEARS